jgi:hypothetical protein
MLIALSKAAEGEEILIVSEYKPCKSCQARMKEIEAERKVNIRVLYILDYEEKGDGDKDVTRDYYKSIGLLSGGGDYVYSVV